MNITDSQKKYALMLLAVAVVLLFITKQSKAATNSSAYTPNPNNGGNGTTTNYPPSNNTNPTYPPQTPGTWTPPYVPPNTNTQQQGSGNGNSGGGVTDPRLRIAEAIKLMSSTSATKPVAYGQTAEYWFNQINQLTLMEIYTLKTFWAEVSNDTQDVNVSGGVKGSYSGVEVGGNAGTTVTINQSMTLPDALNSFKCNDGGWFDWWDYGLTCQTKTKALEKVK